MMRYKKTACFYFCLVQLAFAWIGYDGVAHAASIRDTTATWYAGSSKEHKVHLYNCANTKDNIEEEVEEDPPFRSFGFAIVISLGVGGAVEYLPARHHSIRGTLFGFGFSEIKRSTNEEKTDIPPIGYFGGGLSYRWYSGSRGANGFFVGPVLGFSKLSSSNCALNVQGGPYPIKNTSLTIWSPGLDIGYQFMADKGFTFAFGIGFMQLFISGKVEADDPVLQEKLKNSLKNEPKVKEEKFLTLCNDLVQSGKCNTPFPRVFINLGWAF